MKYYTPTNRRTGATYPAITETERNERENDPHTKGRYIYKEADAPEQVAAEKPQNKAKKTDIPQPVEAKRAVNIAPETAE